MTTPPLPLPQIDPCVFCEIIAKRSPAKIVHEWHDALAIVPLNPVTDGHTLVIPRIHVADVGQDPHVSAAAMRRAAELAATQWCNIITSRGRAATQSVLHLHYHVIPRTEGDGLALPWDDGHRPTHIRATHAEARLDLCRKALLLDGCSTPESHNWANWGCGCPNPPPSTDPGTCTATVWNHWMSDQLRCTRPAGHYDADTRPGGLEDAGLVAPGGWHLSHDDTTVRVVWADHADGATPHKATAAAGTNA